VSKDVKNIEEKKNCQTLAENTNTKIKVLTLEKIRKNNLKNSGKMKNCVKLTKGDRIC
jgi:hypothetical protein